MYKINGDIEFFDNNENDGIIITNKAENRTFIIGTEEAKVLSLMNGVRTANEISRLSGYFSETEVIELAEQFSSFGILENANYKRKFNILKVKVHLFNPNNIIKGNLSHILYYAILSFCTIAIVLGVINAGIHLVFGTDEAKINFIQSVNLSNLTLVNLAVLYLLQFVCFFLHECGHMITARHHDVNVFDMGVMLYWFIPCAYTNLTHMTFISNKKTKLKILFAGIVMDLGIVGLLSFLFSILPLCRLSFYLLVCVLINAVSLVGNLMIFIKYDGYYIFQTILDEQNLRKNSLAILRNYAASFYIKLKNKNKNIKIINTDQSSAVNLIFYIVYAYVSVMFIPIILLGVIFSFF